MGDGETAEGSVWEAAESATHFGIDNLVGITDVNRLGQSRPTIWQHDLGALARRWSGFGWHTLQIDGHDFTEILDALAEARATTGRPTMILAKTFKGRGVSFAEDKEGWHGKAFKAGDEADRAVGELEASLKAMAPDAIAVLRASIPKPTIEDPAPKPRPVIPPPAYKLGDLVATREAYGTALARIGAIDDRIVALDADVGNSTFSDRFEKVAPERFFQHYIAEQVMVGAAMGLAARGAIPFPVDVCLLPHPRLRLHPHGGDQQPEHQAGRQPCRRVHWRGRPVADGAGRPGDDARRAQLHGALSV